VASCVEDSLAGKRLPLDRRLQAVRSLGTLASGGSSAAEEALLRVLREISGDGTRELQHMAGEALWNLWHTAGNSEIDESMRRASALLDKGHHEEAIAMYTRIIESAPEFPGGWNKRAMARFLLQDYEASIADCREVLLRKPRHFGCLAGMGMCFQAQGLMREAVRCFREALEVHPGLDGPQRVVETFELQEVVNEHLRPQLVRVAQMLSEDGDGPKPPLEDSELLCDWDVHRVESASSEDPASRSYFFRVRVRHRGLRPLSLKSLARFYVLRFDCGKMFPLTKMTEGQSSYVLQPFQEHKFCWHVNVKHELLSAAGGVLFGEEDGGFLNVDLPRIVAEDATADDVERWRLGHKDMGHLNLGDLGVPLAPSLRAEASRSAAAR